jgi:hypothetical protein
VALGTKFPAQELFFLFDFFLLFICVYNAWVISPPCPHSTPSLSPHPLNTQQKLFCPYF